MQFFTYPKESLPDISGYILLDLEAPPLTPADAERGLLLIDGTWRYAGVMLEQIAEQTKKCVRRSIPDHYRTAYPRKQEDCSDPERGLASVEALYIAYKLMGRTTTGLLEHYYWRDSFLLKNHFDN